MNDRIRREIEAVFGPIDDRDQGRVASLNDLDDQTVALLGRLPIPTAVAAVKFLVAASSQRLAEAFVADVVIGRRVPAAEWYRGRVVVPDLPVHDQVTLGRDQVLAALGGDAARRLPADRQAWESGVSWVGAPCRVDPDATYLDLELPLDGAAALTPRPTEPVNSIEVAVRRWHACRLARVLGLDGRHRFTTADVCAAAGLATLDELSEDGRAALAALAAEVDLVANRSVDDTPDAARVEVTGGSIGDAVFGFIGPDSLYTRG